MEIRNTIDVQQLKITPQDADNTYLGIDENGQLVRTKIELSGTGGGGEGFKNLIERNVYPTKIIDWSGLVEEYTLTDEQRAYNIETYEMGEEENTPILIYNGMIFQMSSGHWSSTGEGEVAFSQVVGDVNLMDEIGVMQLLYNQDGDVEFTIKLYNVGGGGADMSDYYTKTEINDMIGDINNILETI